MISNRSIIGYHGCDRSTAARLLNCEEWIPSENDYDWLGSGIYFWENDPGRAWDWATKAKENPYLSMQEIMEPAVVAVIIEPQNPLDMSTSKSIQIVEDAYRRIQKRYAQRGLKLPRNEPFGSTDIYFKKRLLDCEVMNAVNVLLKFRGERELDLFRCPFLEGSELYDGAMFRRDTHVQLCVKNPSIIKGVFIPEEFAKQWKRGA